VCAVSQAWKRDYKGGEDEDGGGEGPIGSLFRSLFFMGKCALPLFLIGMGISPELRWAVRQKVKELQVAPATCWE